MVIVNCKYLKKSNSRLNYVTKVSFVLFRKTNADGRCSDIISRSEFVSGRYKLTFDTDAYFRQINVTGFFPNVDVSCRLRVPKPETVF